MSKELYLTRCHYLGQRSPCCTQLEIFIEQPLEINTLIVLSYSPLQPSKPSLRLPAVFSGLLNTRKVDDGNKKYIEHCTVLGCSNSKFGISELQPVSRSPDQIARNEQRRDLTAKSTMIFRHKNC